MYRLMGPARFVVDPHFFGVEDIPEDRPLLFVGNHTLYGVLDPPLAFLLPDADR